MTSLQRRRISCHISNLNVNCTYLWNCRTRERSYSTSQVNLKQVLPSHARTRFAPSPTGYLHLGSLRTAIFSYLLAKKSGGQFILRIEDTDTKRTIADAQQRLGEELRWAGLEWDEGPEVGGKHTPYNQSQRSDLYQKHALELLNSRNAYRCFCPPEPSAEAGSEALDVASKLGSCRSGCCDLSSDDVKSRLADRTPFTIRFSFSGPVPAWTDVVYGKIQPNQSKERIHVNTLQDTILVKSDGSPTYHFANVVDDHAMEVSHVIRGTEWMPSTALHVALYKAFGWGPPAFAHVGLLTDKDNNKLSKRNFDTDVRSLRQKHGLLPSALVNYLVTLGWQIPGKKETKTIAELRKEFSLKFSRGNAIVNLDKLWFLQRQHANRIVANSGRTEPDKRELKILLDYLLDEVAKRSQDVIDTKDFKTRILKARTLESYVLGILCSDPGNYSTPSQYLEKNTYFFALASQTAVDTNDDPGVTDMIKHFIDAPEVKDALQLWDGPGDRQGADHMTDITFTIESAAQVCTNKLTALVVRLARNRADVATPDKALGGDDEFKRTKEYKDVAAAVFHALRRRLMFVEGPGPSSTKVMAVLGYEETRRRLLGT